ncbi:hypothetical protein AB0K09_08690 [Streptomyces sp. NPDC049577]|uniref:hypothetical protein n=1 Tax=Streptomyces sp. NPDC049577 TaxID=3155153 RepID=UPI0034328744
MLQKAGTARFTSTVTYGSAAGDAVETTRGEQDFVHETAYAERTVRVPDGFPARAALGRPGTTALAVAGHDVYVRGEEGWLRYPFTGSTELFAATADVRAYAGTFAPYGRTIAEFISGATLQGEPETFENGSRRYRATVTGLRAGEILPRAFRGAVGDPRNLSENEVGQGPGAPVALEVHTDPRGRLTAVSMDLTSLLSPGSGTPKDITSIKATYELSGYGDKPAHPLPDAASAADATKVLTPFAELSPGACGRRVTDPGAEGLARAVDCGRPHDLRVVAHVPVHLTGEGEDVSAEAASREAWALCRKEFGASPEEWWQDRSTTGHMAGHSVGKGIRKRDGEYTCYLGEAGSAPSGSQV